MTDFREDLQQLLNRHSKENESNTPDFILAKYLHDCLAAFDHAVAQREAFFGRALGTSLDRKGPDDNGGGCGPSGSTKEPG